MSYLDVLILFVVPLIAAALRWWVAGEERPLGHGLEAVVALVIIANVWTTPWDNLMVMRDVWTYDTGAVIGHIWLIPIEEQLFFTLQTVMTGFFVLLLLSHTSVPSSAPAPRRRTPQLVSLGGLAVAMLTSVAVVSDGASFYFATMVIWFGLPLGIQWWYAADLIWAARRPLLAAIVIPTFYLSLLDRLAISAGVWDISDATSVGVDILGLPIEEIVFFALTNTLVVQGVYLYTHMRTHGWRRGN